MNYPTFTEAHALALYHNAVVCHVLGDQPDLTTRQQAVLLTIALKPGPHELRALADHLKLPKPAITRIIGKLENLGYVRRWENPEDKRVPLFSHTLEAMEWLNAMSKSVMAGMVLIAADE
jgi:DNA-binding MarR family transcriptional regulator